MTRKQAKKISRFLARYGPYRTVIKAYAEGRVIEVEDGYGGYEPVYGHVKFEIPADCYRVEPKGRSKARIRKSFEWDPI
jgi:hypothetical protein